MNYTAFRETHKETFEQLWDSVTHLCSEEGFRVQLSQLIILFLIMISVGAFHAKTYLSDLIAQVQQGQCILITHEGRS